MLISFPFLFSFLLLSSSPWLLMSIYLADYFAACSTFHVRSDLSLQLLGIYMYNSGGPLTFPANLYPVPIFFMHSVLFVCLFYQHFIVHLQQFSLDTWLLLPSPRLACYDQSFPSSSPPVLRRWPWMRYLPFYVVQKPQNEILSHITKKDWQMIMNTFYFSV